MSEITYDKALSTIREIVSEFGEDYVYERVASGCRYVSNGAPSCIVGHALIRWGVNPDLVNSWDTDQALVEVNGEMTFRPDGKYASQFAWDALRGLRRDGHLEITDEAVAFLDAVQWEQDHGTPWGEALQIGRDKFEDREFNADNI
jgi:hypothetical protein